MKTKLITFLCVLSFVLAVPTATYAEGPDPAMVVADTIVVRPACFIATIVGSVFFVVALPFAAASKSVKKTASVLVVAPARATFTRPMGDLDALVDY